MVTHPTNQISTTSPDNIWEDFDTPSIASDPSTTLTDVFADISGRLDAIEERLCILNEPSTEIMDKYDALETAYSEYKLLEKLILLEK